MSQHTPTEADKLLTEREAAEILNIHPETLRRKRVAGDGPAFFRVPGPGLGPVRYTREAIRDYITENTTTPTAVGQ